MARRCRRCEKGETADKPLFKCSRCHRYYHSACHRPRPKEPASNWVCKRCLADRGQPKRRHYHDKPLLSSRAVSPSSDSAPSSGLDTSARASMAPSATTASATSPAPSIASQRIINCSFSGCSAKIDGMRQVVCEAHLQDLSRTDRDRDAFRPNRTGTHAVTAPKVTSSTSHRPDAVTNHRKLLPETDKDRPIMRRKTAGNPPQFKPQQPIAKDSTASPRGELSISPRSPRGIISRPLVFSPPASPGLNGEPARKRQKLSTFPGRPKEKTKVNRILPSRPLSSESNLENRPGGPTSPQSGRRPSNQPSQQAGKARDKEGNLVNKPGAGIKHPVRRVPLGLSNLQFIDNPGSEERPTRSPFDLSGSRLNGSTAHISSKREEDIVGLFPEWEAGRSNSPESRDPPLRSLQPQEKPEAKSSKNTYEGASQDSDSDVPLLRRRIWPRGSRLTNEQSQKTQPRQTVHPGPLKLTNGDLPKKLSGTTKPNLPPPSGPRQADGSPISKKPPQTTHFPLIKLPPTKPHPLQFLRKEIDTARFDALIYSQPGAESPPPDVALSPFPITTTTIPAAPTAAPAPSAPPTLADEPLYLPIDPRLHWPQPHSSEWHAAKQDEIRARGGRKANFGRAAQSLRRQNQQQQQQQQGNGVGDGVDSNGGGGGLLLPEKIAENAAWVRVLRRLRGLPVLTTADLGEGDGEGLERGGDWGEKSGRRGRKPHQHHHQQQQGDVVVGRKLGSGTVMFSGLGRRGTGSGSDLGGE